MPKLFECSLNVRVSCSYDMLRTFSPGNFLCHGERIECSATLGMETKLFVLDLGCDYPYETSEYKPLLEFPERIEKTNWPIVTRIQAFKRGLRSSFQREG